MDFIKKLFFNKSFFQKYSRTFQKIFWKFTTKCWFS